MFKTILCPIDPAEADFGKRALSAAVDLARASGGTLYLLAVLMETPQAVGEYLPPDFSKEQRERAASLLKDIAAETGLPAANVKTEIRQGRAHHEILEAARAHAIDIIVMSSHRTGLATYLIGSTAASVVRHAPTSVMVIRPTA